MNFANEIICFAFVKFNILNAFLTPFRTQYLFRIAKIRHIISIKPTIILLALIGESKTTYVSIL